MLVLSTSSISFKEKKSLSGVIVKVEAYSLDNWYFSYDTTDYFIAEKIGLKEHRLYFLDKKDDLIQNNSGTIFCKILGRNSKVEISDEEYILDDFASKSYYISGKEYKITRLDVHSDITNESAYSFYVLDTYGILIMESRLRDTHARFLPSSLPKAYLLNMLCDLVLTRTEFNRNRTD